MEQLTYGKVAPGAVGSATKNKVWLIQVEDFFCRRNFIIRMVLASIIINPTMYILGRILPDFTHNMLVMIIIALMIGIGFFPRLAFKPLHLLAAGTYKAAEKAQLRGEYIKLLGFNLYAGYSSGNLVIHRDHPTGLAPHQHVHLGLQDACQNIVTFGGIGSGKTTRIIQPMLNQLLAQDCGGLIFDVKSDFKHAVHQLAEKNHRQVKTIGIGGKRLNVIEGLSPEMAASFLKSALILNGGGGGSDPFWLDTATTLCQNGLGVLKYTGDYTLADLYKYLFYPERQKFYTEKARLVLIEDIDPRESAILTNYMDYISQVFKGFDEKVQKGVNASVMQILSGFIHPDIVHAFCTSPDDRAELETILEGDIYLVDLPLSEWGIGGKTVYTLLKLRFFNILQSRPARRELNQDRPVFFLCDEYQEIISANKTGISDLNFWDKSRSAKCIGIVSAQSINSFRAAIGDKTLADTVLQNFRQKFFFRTEDIETIEQMNALAGKVEVRRTSQTEGTSNQGFSNSSNQGHTTAWTERPVIDAALIRGLGPNQAVAFMNINGRAADDILNLSPLFVD